MNITHLTISRNHAVIIFNLRFFSIVLLKLFVFKHEVGNLGLKTIKFTVLELLYPFIWLGATAHPAVLFAEEKALTGNV